MRLTRALVRDFRNCDRADLELAPRLTLLCGSNGAGKTNLLEALYFGCTARSCRTANERELVRRGTEVTRVSLWTQAEDGEHVFEVGFKPGEPKRALADGARVERLLDAAGRPLASVFLPERLELVKGAPALRRAHLDSLVAALWPGRSETRAAYSRALSQRNALIARVRHGATPAQQLDVWDAELARHAVALAEDRRRAVELIEPVFVERAGDLGLNGLPALRYKRRTRASDADGVCAELRDRRSADVERGFTTHGPHRDDLALLFEGRPLRAYGSQGQQRVALLALLFAERDVLADHGRPPLMLLDDVMSELDSERRERLGQLALAAGQTVITTTEADRVPLERGSDVAVIQVRAGRAEPEAVEAAA